MQDSPKYHFIEVSPQKAPVIDGCLHLNPFLCQSSLPYILSLGKTF